MVDIQMAANLLILYGSESGTAQDFAEIVWDRCHYANIPAKCLAFDDYNIHNLCRERLAIFIVATSGQGEVPTNMRSSWRFLLSKKLPSDWLSSQLKYAVLGLGDSSYQKYNYAGKKLHRRLVQLGATNFRELALADEQHQLGIDDVFEKWLSEIFGDIQKLHSQVPRQTQFNKFAIEFFATECASSNDYIPVAVKTNERFTAQNHFQETRLISFSLKDGAKKHLLRYSPGDVLMVLPENLDGSVEIALDALKLCKPLVHIPFYICRLEKDVPTRPQYQRLFGDRAPTLLQCLRFYFDLQTIPKRNFIRKLAKCSTTEMEMERLAELSSDDGIEDYMDYCLRPRRTVAELLRDFPRTSAVLTPAHLFEFFPVIRPRAFSIASSPSAHPETIQLLVARVEYNIARMGIPRLGLCSNFLCSRTAGQKVFVRTRPGIFKIGANRPLLLVGPGTGVAPLRSIVSENEHSDAGSPVLLFFGCRGVDRDFYFSKEWANFGKTKVITAFSRDQPEKIYVQHKIKEHAKEVWELLEREGRIFIAGSSGEMPRAVVAAIKDAVVEFGHLEEQEGEEYIERLEKSGRILYETWA